MGDHDIAQICANGHVITEAFNEYPGFRKSFCPECGAPTITSCQSCKTPIQGRYRLGGIDTSTRKAPRFCHNCGGAYPWTEAKLNAARELSDVLEGLTPNDRELLKKSLDDIVRDTAQTPISAARFKRIAAKAGAGAAGALKEVLIDVASETAKKLIWGTKP